MSRTYRLRGTAKSIAKKWVDCGGGGTHTLQIDNEYLGIIAHGVYNLPCIVVGKPLQIVVSHNFPKWNWRKRGPDGRPTLQTHHYDEIDCHTHRNCLIHAGISWGAVTVMLSMWRRVAYPVSTVSDHPYASPNSKWERRHRYRRAQRRERHNQRMRLWRLVKKNDLDLI